MQINLNLKDCGSFDISIGSTLAHAWLSADEVKEFLSTSENVLKAFKDNGRYLDVFPMTNDIENGVSFLTKHGEEPDYYDFMVRGDIDDVELEDQIYCEIEDVSPDNSQKVETLLTELFKLNEVRHND